MVGGKRSVFCCAAVATLALTLLSTPGFAQEPPGPHCRHASKIEYNSAKELYLLRSQFGTYVKNGPFWHRRFWYCRF
jgi:hypothetical protein